VVGMSWGDALMSEGVLSWVCRGSPILHKTIAARSGASDANQNKALSAKREEQHQIMLNRRIIDEDNNACTLMGVSKL
jgi:hypothetical protein